MSGWPFRRNKYGNKKTELDGIVFDSKKEASRWAELVMLEKVGLISDLQRQVPFEIVPKVGKDRARYYIADFTYMQAGKKVIEDVKSPATRLDQLYRLKRALVLWKYTEAGGERKAEDCWIFREM